MGDSDRHAAESVTAAQREWLAALPQTLPVGGAHLCHATPTSDVECFLEDIRDGELVPAPLERIVERVKPCEAPLRAIALLEQAFCCV